MDAILPPAAPAAIPAAPVAIPAAPATVAAPSAPVATPAAPVAQTTPATVGVPAAPVAIPGGTVAAPTGVTVGIPAAPVALPGGTVAAPTGTTVGIPNAPVALPGGTVAGPTGTTVGIPNAPVAIPGGPVSTSPVTAAKLAPSITTGAFADQSFKTFLTSNVVPTAPLSGTSSFNSFLNETGLTSVSTTDFASYFQVKAQSLQTLVDKGLSNVFATADYKQGNASSLVENSLITTPMVLVGTMPNQKVIGGKADDVLICKTIGAVISGGSGLNTVVMGDDKANTKLVQSGNSWIVTGSTSSATLNDVQRVTLSDTSVALDVGGNAGTTAKILGAVFGKDAVKNKAYVGIGLDLLDKGNTSFEKLAELALGASGAKTSEEIVTKLWTNLMGTAPTPADKAPFVKMLENGTTPGALCKLAAESSINVANIDLVGLAKTGIEFAPPVS